MFFITRFFSLLCILCHIVTHSAAPSLLIKIPTRSRPQQFIAMLDQYYDKLSNTIPYHFLITCDTNDATMNNEAMKQRLATYPHLSVTYSNNTSKIEAYNYGIDAMDFDIAIITSDDMEPVALHYDKIIVDMMLKYFPDFDGVLNFSDGCLISQCNTMPVIGRKFYDRFKYAYHPGYKAFWCDVELTMVSRMLRKEKTSPQVIIQHRHWALGNADIDELYTSALHHEKHDKELFTQRMRNRFDIDEATVMSMCSKVWSIIICTSGKNALWQKQTVKKLRTAIKAHSLEHAIEVIVDTSTTELGHLRNEVARECSGMYFNFIDPSTPIPDNYITTIFEALKNNPDVVIPTFGTPSTLPLYQCPLKRTIGLCFPFIEKDKKSEHIWQEWIHKSKLLKHRIVV